MPNMKASLRGVMDTIVPITRFNRGEANKIFEEVEENGYKIVLKNNIPVCVLVQPDLYESMTAALEHYASLIKSDQTIEQFKKESIRKSGKVLSELGILDAASGMPEDETK
jgi:antitoxin StbD